LATILVQVSISSLAQDSRQVLVDSLLNGIKVEKNIRYNLTGRPLLLDIYYPSLSGKEMLPCVVWIHGGALTDKTLTKDYDLVRWGIARTTQNGYISVSIDYRLLPESPLPACIQDCETAIRFLKSHSSQYRIDTTRMAVIGESAGGYLAGFCSFAGNTGIFKTNDWNDVSGNIACGILWYPAISYPPYDMLDYVSPDDVPVLSVHGDADDIVPIDVSYKLKSKCNEKGVDFQLSIIKNAKHGFFNTYWQFNEQYRQDTELAIKITLEFLDRHLK
jgi:acetyl esterase/lipase